MGQSPSPSASAAKPNEGLEHAAELIRSGKARKIAVLTGAGISTSAGIPDFRSKGTGLYDNLQALDLPTPEAVFSIDYFKFRPEPFWTLAKDLYPGKYFPTPTHYFLKLLHDKGVLQRVWSQNIDTLETAAGVPPDLVVEAHGSFRTAHCLKCRREASTEYVLKAGVRKGSVVRCDKCDGLVKPDIVFFGEGLPDNFFRLMPELSRCDLAIVIGTSLQVYPFAGIIEDDFLPESTPRLLINREAVGPFGRIRHGKRRGRDGVFLGDADDAVRELVRAIGWEEELDALMEAGQKRLEKEWSAMEAMARGEEVAKVGVQAEVEKGKVGKKIEAKNIQDEEEEGKRNEDRRKEKKEDEERKRKEKEEKEMKEPLWAKAEAIEAETAKDKAADEEIDALAADLAGVKVDEPKAKV